MSLRNSFLGLACVILLASSWTFAADAKKETLENENGKKETSPSFLPVQDVAGLPRVLIIGDSISMGYTIPTRKLLEGKANVHRPPANCGPSSKGVANIDAWLGEGKWDVIHFNFGIHDLKYNPDGKEHQVPPAQYEKNLRALVEKMKKTGATVIFATTTPVPDYDPLKKSTDAPAYNKIALKVMAEEGVTVDDLYTYILPKVDELQLPKNVHFKPAGSQYLAKQVAASISAALADRTKASATEPAQEAK